MTTPDLRTLLKEKYERDRINYQKEKEQYYRDWLEKSIIGKSISSRITQHNFARDENLVIQKSDLTNKTDMQLFLFYVEQTGLGIEKTENSYVLFFKK